LQENCAAGRFLNSETPRTWRKTAKNLNAEAQRSQRKAEEGFGISLHEISAQLARRLNIPKIVFPAKAGIQFCFVISNP
jgi:hypothetical protein